MCAEIHMEDFEKPENFMNGELISSSVQKSTNWSLFKYKQNEFGKMILVEWFLLKNNKDEIGTLRNCFL